MRQLDLSRQLRRYSSQPASLPQRSQHFHTTKLRKRTVGNKAFAWSIGVNQAIADLSPLNDLPLRAHFFLFANFAESGAWSNGLQLRRVFVKTDFVQPAPN